jgi:RNA polymerase sigma-70 factor, ECF subfamily
MGLLQPVLRRDQHLKAEPLAAAVEAGEPAAADLRNTRFALSASASGGTRSTEIGASLVHADAKARLRWMVENHVEYVARVLRNAGTPTSDVDDQVQRTFMVAARRLEQIEPGKEKYFLFGVALNLAAHVRRTLARRREVLGLRLPERVEGQNPENLLDRKRMRELLDRVLGQMKPIHREVFVLHEFEQMPVSEIAATMRISRGTAASRLRCARADFRLRVAQIDGTWVREGES